MQPGPASRFDQILDICIHALLQGDMSVRDCVSQYPQHHGSLEPLLDLTTRLQSMQAITASPDFHQAAAARMANLIASRPRKAPSPVNISWPFTPEIKTRRARLSPITLVSLIVVLILAVTSGVVSAANNSLPGDGLYPVKKSIESAQLAFNQSESSDAELHLSFASRRLSEATQLLQEDRAQNADQPIEDYAGQIGAVLSYLDQGEQLPAEEHVTFARMLVKDLPELENHLQNLAGNAPPTAQTSIDAALSVSQLTYQRALTLLAGHKESQTPQPSEQPRPTLAPATSTQAPRPTATPAPRLSSPEVPGFSTPPLLDLPAHGWPHQNLPTLIATLIPPGINLPTGAPVPTQWSNFPTWPAELPTPPPFWQPGEPDPGSFFP